MIRLVLVILWFIVFLIATLPLFLFEIIYRQFNKDKSELQCQEAVRFLMRGILFLSGVNVTVKGKENIPENEAVLFVPNHRSYFDFVISFCNIKSPVLNVGKKELAYIPVIGQWVMLIGTFLLDRSNRMKGYRIIEESAVTIKEGKSVVIYPEGTRNKGKMEEPLRFKEGSLKISTWSGCRCIPVAMLHTRDIYENHRPFIKKTDVTLIFGEPIDPAQLTKEELKNYGAMVRNRIVDMILTEEGEKNG